MFCYGFLSHFVHSFPTFTARDTNFCISSDMDNKIILVEALDQIKKRFDAQHLANTTHSAEEEWELKN